MTIVLIFHGKEFKQTQFHNASGFHHVNTHSFILIPTSELGVSIFLLHVNQSNSNTQLDLKKFKPFRYQNIPTQESELQEKKSEKFQSLKLCVSFNLLFTCCFIEPFKLMNVDEE